jgi:hypothetical protein
MLPEPPCIGFLVGCDDGDLSSGSVTIPSYSSSRSSVTIPPYQGNSSSVSIPSRSSSSSISIPSRSSSSSSASVPSMPGAKDLFAFYTVSLKNIATNPLRGLRIDHGPLPSGATFDPSFSSLGCSLLAPSVRCAADLDAGKDTKLSLAYRVSDAAFCRSSSALQSVRATLSDALGTSAQSSLLATVDCGVKTRDQMGSPHSFSSSSVQNVIGTSGRSSSTRSVVIPRDSDRYNLIPTPQTGNESLYFASIEAPLQLTKISSDDPLHVDIGLFLVIFSILGIFSLGKSTFSLLKGI